MNKTFVGNVFRELDPSGARDRDLAMEGEDTNEEICCECSVLFNYRPAAAVGFGFREPVFHTIAAKSIGPS